MTKRLERFTFLSWLLAIVTWQIMFNSQEILAPVLWEIHTIFSSVIVFFLLVSLLVPEKILDIIKIVFRILFKVWFVIFIAFSLKKAFNLKGFILTATFAFGYLEGLIDLNSWLTNQNAPYLFEYFKVTNLKKARIQVCIILLSLIHIFSAQIAFVFFKTN